MAKFNGSIRSAAFVFALRTLIDTSILSVFQHKSAPCDLLVGQLSWIRQCVPCASHRLAVFVVAISSEFDVAEVDNHQRTEDLLVDKRFPSAGASITGSISHYSQEKRLWQHSKNVSGEAPELSLPRMLLPADEEQNPNNVSGQSKEEHVGDETAGRDSKESDAPSDPSPPESSRDKEPIRSSGTSSPIDVLTRGSLLNGFPTYQEAEGVLDYLIDTFGDQYITRHLIGKSYEGKSLHAYRIGGILKQCKIALMSLIKSEPENFGSYDNSFDESVNQVPLRVYESVIQLGRRSPSLYHPSDSATNDGGSPMEPRTTDIELQQDDELSDQSSTTKIDPLFVRVPASPNVSVNLSYLSQFSLKNSPDILITALMHGREPASLTVVLHSAHKLLQFFALARAQGRWEASVMNNGRRDHGKGEPGLYDKGIVSLSTEATQALYIMMTREIWIVPFVNPDAYAAMEALNVFQIRKNRRPTCKADPHTGKMMGETVGGVYVNSTSRAGFEPGVDLNRNYDYHFVSSRDGCDPEEYEGPHPFSEPETQAIKALVEQYVSPSLEGVNLVDSFKVAMNLHSFGGFWTHPWNCCKGKKLPGLPEIFFNELREVLHTDKSKFGSAPESLDYSATGEADDWMLAAHKVLAMSPEVGPEEGLFFPGNKEIAGIDNRNYFRLMTVVLKAGAQLNFMAFLHPTVSDTKQPDSESGDSSLPAPELPVLLLDHVKQLLKQSGEPRLITIRIANTGLSGVLGPVNRLTLTGAVLPIDAVGRKEKTFLSVSREHLVNPLLTPHPIGHHLFAGGRYKLTSLSSPFISNGKTEKPRQLSASPREFLYRLGWKRHIIRRLKRNKQFRDTHVFNKDGVVEASRLFVPSVVADEHRSSFQRSDVAAVSFRVPHESLKGRDWEGTTAFVEYHLIVENNVNAQDEFFDVLPICFTEVVATVNPPFMCHCGVLSLTTGQWSSAPAFIESSSDNALCDTAIRISMVDDLATTQDKQLPLVMGNESLQWVCPSSLDVNHVI
eukprot:GHVQ01013926.1.p1 GENE.GHVQ01013926.1~~GHVQ01013926.1.p1  ORF type:complete len:1012 (+),score=90.15 GHVQ01013926.1:444-3479(+)